MRNRSQYFIVGKGRERSEYEGVRAMFCMRVFLCAARLAFCEIPVLSFRVGCGCGLAEDGEGREGKGGEGKGWDGKSGVVGAPSQSMRVRAWAAGFSHSDR